MKTLTWWMAAVFALGATAFGGTGTEADPYTIAEARALAEGATEYWAQGYIVGGAYNNFDSPWTSDYSISCSDTDSESDVNNCLQVKLESDGGRDTWGLATNPGNLGKMIKFRGFRDAYGGFPSFEGVDNSDISEVLAENQPPVIGAVGSKSVIESNTLTFTVTATDPADDDEIALVATALPAGATFTGATSAGTATGTFTWENAGPLGDYSATFQATDKDGSDTETVSINVHDGSGPLYIAFQGFEGTANDTWGITAANYVESTTGTGDTPANQRIRTGSYSWQPRNETESSTSETLELDAVDVSTYSDMVIELHVSTTSTDTNDFGMYPEDTMSFVVALDGEDFGVADLMLTGNAEEGGGYVGVLWPMDATGIATTTAGVSRTVTPASGGIVADGPATVQIHVPDGTASVKFKATASLPYVDYYWNIDDISLTGVNDGGASDYPPSLSVSPDGLEKSVGVSNNVSFTISASEIPNDAGDEVRIWATDLPAGATFAGATNAGGASSEFSWTPGTAGSYPVSFYAGDKDGTNQVDVTITVYEGGGGTYAVVVGLNQYASGYASSLSGCVPDANHVTTNIIKRGEWNPLSVTKLLDSAGTKTAIRSAIASYAATAVAGDTFLYSQSSHGGQYSGTSVFLCAHDADYKDTELAADLSQFAAGVKVVVMVDACHSGGLFKSAEAGTRAVRPTTGGWDLAGIVSRIMDEQRAAKLAAGKRDVLSRVSSSEIGWITAADYDQSSWDGGPNGGGVFMDKVIEGWTNNPPNSCDLNGDNYANFWELYDYSWDVANNSEYKYTTAMAHNTNVLLNVIAGWVGEEAPGGLVVFSNMTAQTMLVGDTLSFPVGAYTAGTNVPVTVTMSTVQDGASYADGLLTFTPATDGATTFNFSGTNANGGSATASLSVTATLPAPTLAAVTDIDNDRFTANWNAVAGAASYLLDVATSDAFSAGSGGDDVLAEDFASLTDTSVPSGWTTSGSSDLDYTGVGYFGASSPAYKFKTDGQWLQSPTFATGATNLQFWALGNNGSGSTYAISGLVNSVWTLIDTVSIAEDGATYNVAMDPQTTQIGFYFTKVVNCALDDVVVQASDAGSSELILSGQSVAGTSFEVTGLDMDTTYYFRVRAVGNLTGPNSEIGSATTTATDTAPSFDAIPNQSATVGALFTLDVSAYDSGYPAPTLTLVSSTADAGDYSFADGTLSFTPSAEGNFEFVFQAQNALGTALATASVAVASAPVYIPVASIADVASDSFTVNWTPCTGATDYQVQVATNSDFTSGGGSEGNLLENGGFETGDSTGWVKFEANYSVVNTDPQEGIYHVTCSATATRDLMQAVNITGDGVTEYEVSFWYKKPSATGNARIWSSWATGGQDSGDSLQPTTYLQAATEWTKVTYYVVPRSGANTLNFEVRTYNGATVLWDNFFVGPSSRANAAPRAIQVDETVSALTYPVTGLEPETLYYARVRMAGGEWSEVVSETTLASGPAAPAFAAIPPQSASVGVLFSLDVSVYDSGNPVPVLSLVSSTAEAGDYSFAGGTLSFTPSTAGAFDFVFLASNELGTAMATATVTAVAGPVELLAPVIQAASGIDATQFNANWQASAGATGYILDVATNETFSGGGEPPVGGNLMSNAGFETGDSTDWDKFEGEYAVVTTDPQEGSYHVNCAATGTRDLMQAVDITGDGVTEYEVSFWYKKPSEAGNSRIWATWATGGQVSGDNLTPSNYLASVSDWTQATYHVVPQSGVNTLNFEVRTYTGATVSWDNFYVGPSSRGAKAAPYVPGYESLDVGNVTTHAVTGLTEGVTYYYRVKAYNASSNSPYSAVTSVVTQASSGDQPAITGFEAPPGSVASATLETTTLGKTYSLQYTTDLMAEPVVWAEADSEAGGGEITLNDNDPADVARYYRVVEQ